MHSTNPQPPPSASRAALLSSTWPSLYLLSVSEAEFSQRSGGVAAKQPKSCTTSALISRLLPHVTEEAETLIIKERAGGDHKPQTTEDALCVFISACELNGCFNTDLNITRLI